MIKPATPKDETKRLAALREYSILDTLPEKEYDDITYLASQICRIPVSLISLIDDKRQWFKSHHGISVTETRKDIAFCAHAINDKNNVLIVPDSRKDERFHDNPLVIDDPYVIFYAGIPLVNSDGHPMGTLCVIDNKPNKLDDYQITALKALSNQVMKLFELRKKSTELEIKIKDLEAQNKGLEQFASVAAHDIQSPLNNIISLTGIFENKYSELNETEGKELLNFINISTDKLKQLIDGILKYSQNESLLTKNKEEFSLNKIINELLLILDSKNEVKFNITSWKDVSIYTHKVAFQQILINLITNGVKYNDKDQPIISIKFEDKKEFVKFSITDNGPGIRIEDKDRIFRLFETTANRDKRGSTGSGIGLSTVKSLIEGLGGTIEVSSEEGKGARFEFTIKK